MRTDVAYMCIYIGVMYLYRCMWGHMCIYVDRYVYSSIKSIAKQIRVVSRY